MIGGLAEFDLNVRCTARALEPVFHHNGDKMNEIRAFVGHSFVDEDSELVGIFLKFFEQISRSHPHFSWEHAEPAEPKLLAEKVMSLLSDKNVFIGICTRKEYAIDPSSISTTFFSKGYHKAPATAFYWKTSD